MANEVIPTQFDSKAKWRNWAKEKRKNLAIKVLSQKICKVLMQWPIFQSAQHILTYRAFDSEFDISALESLPIANKKNFYITRTWIKSKNLTIHNVNTPLEKHSFGYWQPQVTAKKIDPQIIDIALIPGLCFDLLGTRLGYGMGFYDRFLTRLREDTLLVGITTENLVVKALPQDDFDVSMTQLVSEIDVRKTQ